VQTRPSVFTFFMIFISKIASCLIAEIEIVIFWLDLQILLMKSAKKKLQQPLLQQLLQRQLPQLLQQQLQQQLLLQLQLLQVYYFNKYL